MNWNALRRPKFYCLAASTICSANFALAKNTTVPDWHFDIAHGTKALYEQLNVGTLTGFGAENLSAAIGAAGALLRYAQSTQGKGLQHVRTLTVETEMNSSASMPPPAATSN